MKDPLDDVLKYLARVPKGQAAVKDVDVRPQFRGRAIPFLECLKNWVAANGLKMTTDREDNRALALTYFFTKP